MACPRSPWLSTAFTATQITFLNKTLFVFLLREGPLLLPSPRKSPTAGPQATPPGSHKASLSHTNHFLWAWPVADTELHK